MASDRRERRLKKYEAAGHGIPADRDDPLLELVSPFGPMIGRTSVSPTLVERLNRFADTRVAADRSSEFTVPWETARDGGEDALVEQVAAAIRRYVAGVDGGRVERVEFEIFWVVSQYRESPSPVHFHSGDVSGVLYLKTPNVDAGELRRSYISGRQAGQINFLSGGKQPLSKSLISFEPRVGDFYVFPGWLLHVAEPFRGEGERRSLAFNARLELAAE